MNDTLPAPSDTPSDTPPTPGTPTGRGRTVSVWLVVGLLLAAWTIAQGAGWIVAVIGRHSDTVTQQHEARGELVVRVDSGDVAVTADADATSSGTVSLTAHRTWSLREPKLEWTSSGDTLELHTTCGFTFVGWCLTDLDLRVPEGTQVHVQSDSGDVRAAGVHGSVTLTTDSGRVTARDVTGRTSLQTDSGSIEVGHVTGDLDLDTDSGEIDVIGSSAADVVAHTDSGEVRIDLTTDPTRVEATTDSGSIDLRLPDTAGVAYVLALSTDSGRTSGEVRTDPTSTRTVTLDSDSGNVTVAYR